MRSGTIRSAMCQFLVTRSVTKESPVQIKSCTFEYDDPDRVQEYHSRGSRFGKNLICADTFGYDTIRSS